MMMISLEIFAMPLSSAGVKKKKLARLGSRVRLAVQEYIFYEKLRMFLMNEWMCT